MKLTADISGIDAARQQMLRVANLPRLSLQRSAEDVEEFVEAESGKHSKQGDLVASIYLRRVGEAYDIGHDRQRAPHALFVHWGTRPHKIMPKNKKVLRWARGGIFSFARGVNHPGYKGDPWMTRAAAFAPRAFNQHLQTLLAQRSGS